MLLQEVVDEIIEKTPDNMLSIPSILRKITQVRDNLIRNFTPAQQQSDVIVTTLDLQKDVSQYPLPCPPGSVIDVDVKGLWNGYYYGWFIGGSSDQWVQPETYNFNSSTSDTPDTSTADAWFRLPYKSFDERYRGPFYYMLSGTIGVVPTPYQDVSQGLKIFHIPVLSALTVDGLNGPTGFDPNYDMVLVYGVLKDATRGADAAEYTQKYNDWVAQYQQANSGFERYTVKSKWSGSGTIYGWGMTCGNE
jgi:hypothetical protein